MNLEFPYQLSAFIDKEPTIGKPVYYGDDGWYPQIALKRRFKTHSITEEELLSLLDEYCKQTTGFTIHTGGLIKPERMPVKVLEVAPSPGLIAFHMNLLSFIGKAIISRYPERDGDNYLPHITAEYNDEIVIDTQRFSNTDIPIKRVFLLKDIDDENSVAHASFDLHQ